MHLESAATIFRMDFSLRRQHLLKVAMWFPAEGEFTLAFPVWTPGSYMVREYTRQLEQISGTVHDTLFGEAVRALPLQRNGKNRWQGDAGSKGFVCVKYQLYCREMTVRTNWIDDEFASLTPAATFPSKVDGEGSIAVQVQLPAQWAKVATSLELVDQGPTERCYIAQDYHELIDSPLVCGNFDIREFEVAGIPHYIANVGGENLWDLDKAVQDTQTIVASHHEFWQCIPYDRYWFINLAVEGRGGLEHDNSTVLMSSRFAMRDTESYVDWLGLVSHEFFHTWNVRRLRPQTLMQYDYEREQFLEELWIAEGITSYYDDLTLVRRALCSQEQYLARLSKMIEIVQRAPGRLVQNLKSSSWDAWTKLYRPDENSPNARISYYSKGALVAWLLDVEIQRATDCRKSLQDVMRLLWQRHRKTGYVQDDFDRIVREVSSASVWNWLQDQLSHAGELDFDPALGWLGLDFKSERMDADPGNYEWFGCSLGGANPMEVKQVLRRTPAGKAGLMVGDEIIAMNGYRVDSQNFGRRLSENQSDGAVALLVSRRGRILNIEARWPKTSTPSWNLVAVKDAQTDAVQHRESWLTFPELESPTRAVES